MGTDFRTLSPQTQRATEVPLGDQSSIGNWSENYCWSAYDPDARIAFWLHVGRWWRATDLWREVLLLCIDGETVYSQRTVGHLTDDAMVGAAALRLSCEAPFDRWRWRYRGSVNVAAPAALLEAPGIYAETLLDLDLHWNAITPPIDFGHGTEAGSLASHYEQGGSLRGMIEVGDRKMPFAGHAFRDHSRGPRSLAGYGRHAWIHGVFPSGRYFSSMIIESASGKIVLNDVFCGTGHQIERGVFKNPAAVLKSTAAGVDRPYRIDAEAGGRGFSIECKPEFYFPVSIAPPSEIYIGQAAQYEGWRVFQMPTQLCWEGEETWGHSEFSLTLEQSRQNALI